MNTPEWYDDGYRAKIERDLEEVASRFDVTLDEMERHAPQLYHYVNGSLEIYGDAFVELCRFVAAKKLAEDYLFSGDQERIDVDL